MKGTARGPRSRPAAVGGNQRCVYPVGAFNADEPARREAFARIPAGVRVVLSHAPARGQGDRVVLGAHVGCPVLGREVARAGADFLVAGHIHEAYGVSRVGETTFINASSCTLLGRCRHAPIVFDVVVR